MSGKGGKSKGGKSKGGKGKSKGGKKAPVSRSARAALQVVCSYVLRLIG